MKFGLFAIKIKDSDIPKVKNLINSLLEIGIELLFYEPFFKEMQDLLPKNRSFEFFFENEPDDLDLILTIGGDGTLLHGISFTQRGKTPIMGINTGRLGFLTSLSPNEMDLFANIIESKDYYLEKRSLLMAKSENVFFGSWNFALNECTVIKSESTSMITVHTYLDNEYMTSYWCDGLIVSTPTGSTGYSLSCGGPIIAPNSKNFVLTPIAPHNLSIRPIVITDDKVIRLEVEGRSDHFLCTLDSRAVAVQFTKKITLHRAPFELKMVRLKDYSFLTTIRKKLMWGADSRNIK